MSRTYEELSKGTLFTDFYQLTMAQLYYRQGLAERRARFDYFFRSNPHYGDHAAGYCVAAGLEWLIDWMLATRPAAAELEHLRALRGRAGERLFDDDFLGFLATKGSFEGLRLLAVPEGRVVHPNVPLAVVEGPLATAQLLETALLNHLNYQTLVATKAARIRDAARGGTVLEFGMRRAHERGANAASRAALIGGAELSSNTGISLAMGLKPAGTHAHSMVQAFMALGGSELDAFTAYAELYPDDCVLLVDTVDTLASGVPNAIRVFSELKRRGHRPVGIRLDSGDLAHLAILAARQLDAAGLPEVSIVLSNDLDELVIWQIVTQIQEEAPRYGVDPAHLVGRLVYGVGTALVTSRGASALDGVYKLVAIEGDGALQPAIKLSETEAKVLNPGDKKVWRIYDRRGKATADLVALAEEDPIHERPLLLRHPTAEHYRRRLEAVEVQLVEPLLEEVVRKGRRQGEAPPLEQLRLRCAADLERLDPGVKRLMNPHVYHVSLSQRLWEYKKGLVTRLRSRLEPEPVEQDREAEAQPGPRSGGPA
jgi:nicotinate phosphoribosyltransferase